MSEEAVPQHPGVEVQRVPVLRGAEEVRGGGGGGVLQAGVRGPVGRQAQRVVVVVVVVGVHRLREHELRVGVQRGPGLRRRVPAHEGLRGGGGVRVAERGGADGLLRGGGALLPHQGLDGEAAFSRRRRKHGALAQRSGTQPHELLVGGEKARGWSGPPLRSLGHREEERRGAARAGLLAGGRAARAPTDPSGGSLALSEQTRAPV